ncbi:unnamed protein product [Prorocentrum cordatum]|uniref:DNA helicase n=1 Tax=Prorocentrum cordatum TaxID=2364126 RepID=A0ABN9R4I8_9DINO|nr:unnamed protein product [Polarella glacialis]
MFIQQCGRAIRMYGHRGLPEEEHVVTTKLYVATFPRWLRGSSLACWALRAQKKHTSGKEVEKRGRRYSPPASTALASKRSKTSRRASTSTPRRSGGP